MLRTHTGFLFVAVRSVELPHSKCSGLAVSCASSVFIPVCVLFNGEKSFLFCLRSAVTPHVRSSRVPLGSHLFFSNKARHSPPFNKEVINAVTWQNRLPITYSMHLCRSRQYLTQSQACNYRGHPNLLQHRFHYCKNGTSLHSQSVHLLPTLPNSTRY